MQKRKNTKEYLILLNYTTLRYHRICKTFAFSLQKGEKRHFWGLFPNKNIAYFYRRKRLFFNNILKFSPSSGRFVCICRPFGHIQGGGIISRRTKSCPCTCLGRRWIFAVHRSQASTVRKGISTDICYVAWYGNRCQSNTIAKGNRTNICHAVRNWHRGQASTSMKGFRKNQA